MQIGDVIAICLSNIPEFPIATLGAIEAGLIVTTMNPIYTVGMSIYNQKPPHKIFIIKIIF